MYQTPLFGLSIVKSPGTSQYGFVISKKISKKAVDRNKIRRRLAEIIKIYMLVDVKVVVLVKKSILTAKSEEIENCWKTVYEKINSETNSVL